MKILLSILLIIPLLYKSQLPYTWVTGVNPLWTSINTGLGNSLTWNSACSVVTTNCSGNYSNNQNTTYTSPTINTNCSNSSSVNITFSASGNAEYRYDFLFIEYSLNNGSTWINPYGVGTGWTGNFGTGSTIPAISVPTSSNFRFRFRFQSDGSFNYIGYKIMDFDIWCNTVLPIELISFDGYFKENYNLLTWSCATEINNDFFTIDKSLDGINWLQLSIIDASGTTNNITSYSIKDFNPDKSINYYRLKQTDLNGKSQYFNIIDIDNTLSKDKKVISIFNLIGQEVGSESEGVLIYTYSDGTHERICKMR
jgi:hypothetical protein